MQNIRLSVSDHASALRRCVEDKVRVEKKKKDAKVQLGCDEPAAALRQITGEGW